MLLTFVLLSASRPRYDAFLSIGQTLFAARQGSVWTNTSKRTEPPAESTAWTVTLELGTERYDMRRSSFDADMGTWLVDNGSDDGPGPETVMAWGPKPGHPRTASVVEEAKKRYGADAIQALRAKGVQPEIEEIAACRVDLAGDGATEVIVTCQANDRRSGEGYGLAFLQSGTRRTYLFFQKFAYPKLLAVADLVGKGQMQFVIAGGEQDGSFAFLWDYENSAAHRLASFEFSL